MISSKVLDKIDLENTKLDNFESFKDCFKLVLKEFVSDVEKNDLNKISFGDLDLFYSQYLSALNNIYNSINKDFKTQLRDKELYENHFIWFKKIIDSSLTSQKNNSESLKTIREKPDNISKLIQSVLKSID